MPRKSGHRRPAPFYGFEADPERFPGAFRMDAKNWKERTIATRDREVISTVLDQTKPLCARVARF